MGLDWPLGLQVVEAPKISKKLEPEGGKVFSCFYPQKYPQYSFLLRVSQAHCRSVARRIKSMKDPNDPIRNQTCDLLACRAVPQPNVLKHPYIMCSTSVLLFWLHYPIFSDMHLFFNEVCVTALYACLYWSLLCIHLKFIMCLGNERSFRPTKKLTHVIIFNLRHVSVYFTQM